MFDQNAPAPITAVDFTPDTAFVTFANGVLVTYPAPFLFSVRDHDSNQVITGEADAEQELVPRLERMSA